MQDIHPDNGLDEIIFSNFLSVGKLDEGVLDRLHELSNKLTKLSIGNMSLTSGENR